MIIDSLTANPGRCVFVGGPIQHAINGQGHFSPVLRQVISGLISALEDADYKVLSAHRHERFGEMDVRGKYREVCQRDHAWMRECTLFCAVLPVGAGGVPVHSAGTAVELGWASAMGKPVVLVRDMAAEYSHLVAGLDAVTELRHVDINTAALDEAVIGAIADLLTPALAPAARA